MDKAVLLTKLMNYDDTSFELYQYYINATSKVFVNEIEEFNVCIESLKFLSNKQYDFKWLSENSNEFECNRRDFKALCDDVCVLLGNRIEELCRHTKNPIITKPTNYEDYCPFPKESLVAYGSCRNTVYLEGKTYKIIDTKLETTPYYTIYCNTFDF